MTFYKRLITFMMLSLLTKPLFVMSQGFEDREKRIAEYNEFNKNFREQLIGKEIWFYPNHELCQINKIRKDINPGNIEYSNTYESDKPFKMKVLSNFNTSEFFADNFFKLAMEDGSIGYINSMDVKYINNGEGKLRSGDGEIGDAKYRLEKDCFFSINPSELQSKIDKKNGFKKEDEKVKRQQNEIEIQKAEQEKIERVQNEKLAEIEKEKQQDEVLKSHAYQILMDMDKDDFCVAYGKFLANQKIKEIGSLDKNLPSLMKKEVKRRKLVINTKLAKSDSIHISMTECELYAAVGLPTRRNRSSGTWGNHIQHIYNFYGGKDFYVYTENGRVTSWQE